MSAAGTFRGPKPWQEKHVPCSNIGTGRGVSMVVATTQPRISAGPVGVDRGRARPGWARITGLAWTFGHVLIGAVVANVVARTLFRPRGWLAVTVWLVGLAALAGVTMTLSQRRAPP